MTTIVEYDRGGKVSPFTDRAGLEVMTAAECDAYLVSNEIGRVAFVSDGDVAVFPVNYRWVDASVVFRTGIGAKMDAAMLHKPVAFEIDGWDLAAQQGWSVLVKGVAGEVTDAAELTLLATTGLRPWVEHVDRDRWVRIRPDEITGRKII